MILSTDWNLALHADDILLGQGADPLIVRASKPSLLRAAERALADGLGLIHPVALTTGMRGSFVSKSPASRAQSATCDKAFGAAPNFFKARSNNACVASAVSGTFLLGFQITLSPQTKASAAFHAHTATGKLKAEITATGPAGCQVSIMRWPRRSLAMVRP